MIGANFSLIFQRKNLRSHYFGNTRHKQRAGDISNKFSAYTYTYTYTFLSCLAWKR